MEPIEIRIRIIIQPSGTIRLEGDGVYVRGTVTLEDALKTAKITITKIECQRYAEETSRKPAKSCKGCTVQCYMKGRYNGEPIEIKK